MDRWRMTRKWRDILRETTTPEQIEASKPNINGIRVSGALIAGPWSHGVREFVGELHLTPDDARALEQVSAIATKEAPLIFAGLATDVGGGFLLKALVEVRFLPPDRNRISVRSSGTPLVDESQPPTK